MGIQDEIKKETEELKQDEALLVKVFKLEKFVKKYKKHIILTAIILAAYLIGYNIYTYIQEQNLIKANNAFETLLQNPNDKRALEIVKKDKKLYNLYLFNKGEYSKVNSKELEALKAYEIAMKKGTKEALESYILNPSYKILKDSARFALMRIYLEEHNRKKALEVFDNINQNSKFKTLGAYLLHYGIVK